MYLNKHIHTHTQKTRDGAGGQVQAARWNAAVVREPVAGQAHPPHWQIYQLPPEMLPGIGVCAERVSIGKEIKKKFVNFPRKRCKELECAQSASQSVLSTTYEEEDTCIWGGGYMLPHSTHAPLPFVALWSSLLHVLTGHDIIITNND